MLKKFFIVFLFLGFGLYAQNSSEYEHNNQIHSDFIEKVLDLNDVIILNLENKIYIRPDRLIPTDHGLVLLTYDNEEIVLPKVFSDNNGCFIELGYSYFPTGTTYYCRNCEDFRRVTSDGCCVRCGLKIKHSR